MTIEVHYDKISQLIMVRETNTKFMQIEPQEASQLIRDLKRVLKEEVYCQECKGVGFDPPSGEVCRACGGDGMKKP